MNDNNRNFLLAAVLSLAVVFAWQAFIVAPRIEAEREAAELTAQQDADAPAPATANSGTAPAEAPAAAPGLPSSSTGTPGTTVAEPAATAQTRRIEILTPKVDGSINLRGARIDDLNLALYHETVDQTSPEIRLLAQTGTADAYFAEFGFSPDPALGSLPGPSTVWSAPSRAKLTPETPVTLTTTNEQGLTFERTIAVDEDYMFTITDVVRNADAAPVALRPYGRLARYGEPETEGIYVIHEGLIGSVGDQGLDEIDYDDIQDDRQIVKEPANDGWIGITDKYWATALIPGQRFTAHYNYYAPTGQAPFYQADYLGEAVNVPANGELTLINRLFAGAKVVSVIDGYQDSLDIPLFSNLIDWGWFYFLTKPMFAVMDWIYKSVGNFGVSILLVTVIVKLIFFPLANLSYKSMARMKKVQPQMTEIRERHGDDRAAMQKAMMQLYKTEKINPAAGCWPMLLQIPVFFALYKVIYVTIEMRHAPFFGWVNDLSAPDPTSILNLFGLLPFDSPAALAIVAIGVWPLVMGITMFVQMQMNPAPPDPTQAMIFKWMPIMFTFMLATFPVGLVIYWAWNNTLSVLQQGFIMHRQGVKIELWDNLKRMFGRKKADADA
jgi:YidC/Oxa1 family membrane protein insertase